jgi:prepilin-type N-terminal cleavage/methylation domain-containing protein
VSTPRNRAFTLVELAVTLVILSVAAAILLPSLPRLTGSEQKGAMRSLAFAIQENRDEAVFKKKA